MRVSREGCRFVAERSGLLAHRCDTLGGSSGSAILLADYSKPENTRVVGVHAFGGCNDNPESTNSGPSIGSLAEKSPLLRSLVR